MTPTRPHRSRLSVLWPLALTLFLLAALIGVNLAYPLAVNYAQALNARPGEVIYAAAFDGFTDEWQQYQGRLEAQITDETLQIRVDDFNSTAYSVAQPTFADFDARVTATAIDGPIDNGYGLVFRLQQDHNPCDMPLVLLCDLSQLDLLSVPLRLLFRPQSASVSTYTFLISSDGYYSLWRDSERVSTWIPSDLIHTGLNASNRLRVVGRGDHFRFFINGVSVPLCIADDPDAQSTYFNGDCLGGQMMDGWLDQALPQGQIGLTATSTATGGPGVVVRFDNLIITRPEMSSEANT